ncbi:hypothetical protein [Clostridium sp.]
MEDIVFFLVKWFLLIGGMGAVIGIICFLLLKDRKVGKRLLLASSIFLIMVLIGCIILLIFISMPTIDNKEVVQIIETGVSKDVLPGKIVMVNDKVLSQRDFKIIVDSKTKQITISIWDFAAEDGDEVQIINNGNPLGKEIILMNMAKTVIVPINGKIEVKGIKDGGGGITYALYVKETGETYFNNAPINGVNTYTIINSN